MAVVGIGLDLVDIGRAERLLARHGDRALRRLLLPAERAYVTGRTHRARHLAVRLAAKEAVFKALASLRGASTVGWRDIEVVRDRGGRPGIRLHGAAAAVADRLGRWRVLVALSHTAQTAGAVAVLEADPSPGG